MRVIGANDPVLMTVAFDQDTEQCLIGSHREIQAVEVFDGCTLGLRKQSIVITFAGINRCEPFHQVWHLRAAAFKKTEAKLWKRVEHAAEHEISDGNRILHRVTESAPKAIPARGIMPGHAPAADNRSGVHGMKNDRYSELFRFGIKRPELLAVEIVLTDRRVADDALQAQLPHGSIQLIDRQPRSLHRERCQAEKPAGMLFHDTADGVV